MKKSKETIVNVGVYRLKMSDSQTAILINDTQARITKHMSFLEAQGASLKEYETAYLELKREYDAAKLQLEEDNVLLDGLSRIANKLPPGKALKVVRAESHNDMKEKEKEKYRSCKGQRQFLWKKWGMEILTQENRFMEPKELLEKVCEKHHVDEILENTGRAKKHANIKWGAVNAVWGKSDAYAWHKGLVGLATWMDDKKHPDRHHAIKLYPETQPALSVINQ